MLKHWVYNDFQKLLILQHIYACYELLIKPSDCHFHTAIVGSIYIEKPIQILIIWIILSFLYWKTNQDEDFSKCAIFWCFCPKMSILKVSNAKKMCVWVNLHRSSNIIWFDFLWKNDFQTFSALGWPISRNLRFFGVSALGWVFWRPQMLKNVCLSKDFVLVFQYKMILWVKFAIGFRIQNEHIEWNLHQFSNNLIRFFVNKRLSNVLRARMSILNASHVKKRVSEKGLCVVFRI